MDITSRDNRMIKEYRRLLSDARYRRECGRFVVEGARLCADAVASGITPDAVFLTDHARRQYPMQAATVAAAAREVYTVPESIAAHLADTATPQGMFVIAALPPLSAELRADGRYVALEALQDPGNVGTVIRTAEAFGLDGVLLSDGCCDPYSAKVLRASMGGVFRLPLYAAGDLAVTLPRLAQQGLRSLACVVSGDAVAVQEAAWGRSCVAVIGNEGNGLRPETVEVCSASVTIPMAGRAESLNASMAAGIVLWEMVRKDGAAHA